MKYKKNVLKKYYLWLSCFFHDSSVSFIDESWKILYSSLEERFSKIKHDSSFPYKSLEYWFIYLNINLNDINEVFFYEKPLLRFFLDLKSISIFYPFSFYFFFNFLRNFFKNYNELNSYFCKYKWEINYIDHHISHASLSYYLSNFSNSWILVVDWVWDNSTISLYEWNKKEITLLNEVYFPNSIWLLYSLFTIFCWFEANEWEYKMMWLASYWKPIYVDKIYLLIKNNNINEFELDISYFNFSSFKNPFKKKFIKLFWIWRKKGSNIDIYYKDIASSIQKVLEDIIIKYLIIIKYKYDFNNMCFWWWVFLNCKLNKEIYDKNIFNNIFIPPNPWDWWNSLGAVLYWFNSINNTNKKISYRKIDYIFWWYNIDIEVNIDSKISNYKYDKFDINDDEEYFSIIFNYLKNEKIVSLIQWSAEFWPRALWNRSIISSPFNSEMKDKLNKIKWREFFRPFAPVVLDEDFNNNFIWNIDSPYMMYLDELKNSKLSAITHVDNTARTQVLKSNNNNNNFLYLLLKYYKKYTWFWVLLNTSFNMWWEVMVNNIDDALFTFKRTNISLLVINKGNKIYILYK